MYKSPIEIFYGQMQTQMEGDIYRAVQSYGINVDKDELIRALQYDRQQYDIGYADGKRDAMAELAHGYWIDSFSVDHTGRITEHSIDCSVCESVFKADRRDVVQHWKKEFKRCPFCGAIMDGGNEDA